MQNFEEIGARERSKLKTNFISEADSPMKSIEENIFEDNKIR